MFIKSLIHQVVSLIKCLSFDCFKYFENKNYKLNFNIICQLKFETVSNVTFAILEQNSNSNDSNYKRLIFSNIFLTHYLKRIRYYINAFDDNDIYCLKYSRFLLKEKYEEFSNTSFVLEMDHL